MPGLILDILVIFVLLVSAVVALLRGFVREVLTIAGLIGGVAAAVVAGPLLGPLMRGWMGVAENAPEAEKLWGVIPWPYVADAAAYGGVFLLVVIALSILSHILSESLRSIGLGPLDRTLGFIFGLLRGVLIVGLLYLPFYYLLDPETKGEWFETSRTQFYMETTAGLIAGFIPADKVEEVEKQAAGGIENARQKLETLQILNNAAPAPNIITDLTPAETEGYPEQNRDKMEELLQRTLETNE